MWQSIQSVGNTIWRETKNILQRNMPIVYYIVSAIEYDDNNQIQTSTLRYGTYNNMLNLTQTRDSIHRVIFL